jgi:hypothetical protein
MQCLSVLLAAVPHSYADFGAIPCVSDGRVALG